MRPLARPPAIENRYKSLFWNILPASPLLSRFYRQDGIAQSAQSEENEEFTKSSKKNSIRYTVDFSLHCFEMPRNSLFWNILPLSDLVSIFWRHEAGPRTRKLKKTSILPISAEKKFDPRFRSSSNIGPTGRVPAWRPQTARAPRASPVAPAAQ